MANCRGRVAPRATFDGNAESAPSFGRDPAEDAVPRPAADAWTTSKEATTNQNAALVARRTSRSLTGATTVSDAVARARRIVACGTPSESSRRHCRDRRRAPKPSSLGPLCLAEPEYRHRGQSCRSPLLGGQSGRGFTGSGDPGRPRGSGRHVPQPEVSGDREGSPDTLCGLRPSRRWIRRRCGRCERHCRR
jgi:hypothetical protein